MLKKPHMMATASLALVLGVGTIGVGAFGAQNAFAADESASAEAASSASAAADDPVGDMYVDVAWLKSNIEDVVVVDARANTAFAATHIPGAVNLTWQQLSNVVDVAQGEAGWAELDDPATIRAAAEAAGIDGTKPVVVYTDVKSGWGEDGRIMWTLREAGIKDVKVLDGGWRKWVGQKGDLEDGKITNVDESAAAPEVDADAIEDADPIEQVDTAFVKEHLKDATLVDARLEAEYEGQTVMGESRMGRIPGAVSIPNVSLFNQDSTIKTDEELADIFEAAGLTDKDALVITYCTGGVRGANVAEILADHGFTNVKVYTAGFSEWAGDPANEVEAEAEVPSADE